MRLIDANKLKPIQVYRGDVFCEMVFMGDIENAPTVDAEPVVRCKDCKWCHGGYCEKADDIIPFGFAHHEWENFYCAWGRKDNR